MIVDFWLARTGAAWQLSAVQHFAFTTTGQTGG